MLAVDRRSLQRTWVRRKDRRSTFYSIVTFDKATRLTAGSRRTPMRLEPYFLADAVGRELQACRRPFVHEPSGDDGIRTRGLRLAKALLSR